MPLLVALDECFRALSQISIQAELGLESPEHQAAALRLILQYCDEADRHVGDIAAFID